ncbi:hypothetical protein BGZ96_008913 [Linnemannia gamsii]|uniref:Uncharacterized protein n=1 Tax=Linnemannia gamsii TaxID=64522 RepID=A0ABQ7JXU6_9FUNG|nr:hypothetical protein BGZ96_008913 [Linnemannia gamsii]
MKIFSVSLCLAAAAVCVAAQPTPEQGTQQSYFALALQRDEPQDIVSEFDYRGDILARYNVGGFEEQAIIPTPPSTPVVGEAGDPCKDILNLVGNMAKGLDTLLDAAMDSLKFPEAIKATVNTIAAPIKAVLEAITKGDISDLAFGAVHTALGVAITALKLLSITPVVGPLISKAVEAIEPIQKIFEGVHGCDKSKIAIEMGTCSTLADMYRTAVKATAQNFPSANDANNEELKNLISASVAILGLMEQTSIASSNDALLSTRPIFSASLLDQYRLELIQKADSDSLKQFAQADLAFLISISNGLEACLHVAADPEAAADELAEEYEAMDDDEEYDDEE